MFRPVSASASLAIALRLALAAGVSSAALISQSVSAQTAPSLDTEKLMLSGEGPNDAVQWDFEIDGGMRANQPSKIPVPSNWQQQGFGHYQYGYDKGPRAGDKGVYRRRFSVPAGWKGKAVRIYFDGVMTDATVKINGTLAGPVHQGGFNRFSYDITSLVKVGADNEIQVEVSEASAAKDTDIAERHGDYWVFGGIYRPVWLEATPAQSIAGVAINASANGNLTADITLAAPRSVTRVTGQIVGADGKPVGQSFQTAIPAGGTGRMQLRQTLRDPALWSAETPNLYTLNVTLYDGDTPVHRMSKRFGFRTFEVRDQGLYLNGQRIMLKGVNRHSFRADTGRALSRADAYADVREIRDLNMNAVRMSHYAPEETLLEAADELGLYVINELSGWQHAHDTEVGRKLVRSLVERDVNHPSILFWANGNEGGWNRELDGDFALYDPQHRPVIHPWELFGGIDTKHYPRYPDLVRRLGGKSLVLPTEFLHGLYDGGAGAGLDDYWRAMTGSPRGAGGFLWNFADEGIARTDQGGSIDTYAAYAPDGIVGPRHEKEPSYFTVKEVWSPVQIEAPVLDARFDGALAVQNHYDFTSLSRVKFRWEWIDFATPTSQGIAPRIVATGEFAGPDIAPHTNGKLQLPASAKGVRADALRLTATNGNDTLWTWAWPSATAKAQPANKTLGTPQIARDTKSIQLRVGSATATFDGTTGLLTGLRNGKRYQSFSAGPQLVVARPKTKEEPKWVAATEQSSGIYVLPDAQLANVATVDLGTAIEDGWGGFKLEVSADLHSWTTVYDGARTSKDGQDYAFPAQTVRALRITGLRGVRATPTVRSVKVAGEAARFAVPTLPAATVTTGQGRDPASGRPVAWIEAHNAGGLDTARWTLGDDGRLTLDYRYNLSGEFLYHGLGFDGLASQPQAARALVRGPSPVWQNRLRGPVLGVYDIAAANSATLPSPKNAGYFADPRWLTLKTGNGALTITNEGAPYLQLGARLADFPTTTVAFPSSNFGFFHAIPAMGAKGQNADLTGPAGAPAKATGTYSGKLTIAF